MDGTRLFAIQQLKYSANYLHVPSGEVLIDCYGNSSVIEHVESVSGSGGIGNVVRGGSEAVEELDGKAFLGCSYSADGQNGWKLKANASCIATAAGHQRWRSLYSTRKWCLWRRTSRPHRYCE